MHESALQRLAHGFETMIEIVHFSESWLPQVKQLFCDYPHKSYQQKKQRLDRDKLAQFLLDAYRTATAHANASHFLAVENASLLGLASLSPDSWHASVYDLPMAKINYFMSYRRAEEVAPLLLDRILNAAQLNRFRHLSCRFDANEWSLTHLFERSGFYIVDCSMKMSRDLQTAPPSDAPMPQGLRLVPFDSTHESDVLRIASFAHQYNHFYADPNLPNHLTNALFGRWVKRCIDGLAKYVFVALLEDTVIGFVTFLENSHFNAALNTRILVLDFIVLDTPYQHRGLGTPFLRLALDALPEQCDFVELRTSHNNYPALNLYSRFGFHHVATDLILHRFTT